jgi:hypothetical protein
MSEPVTQRIASLRLGDPSRMGPYELLGRLGSGGMDSSSWPVTPPVGRWR